MIGTYISEAEVTNIDKYGIWIFVNKKEYFLSHKEFPWFKNAKISEILNVKLLKKSHLYWPELDIDLSTEILKYPDKYPLIYT